MSIQRIAAPLLATICGVCTAYTTFAPELQKQQAEREGTFEKQHTTSNDAAVSAAEPPTNQTIISNDASIGAAVKDALNTPKESEKDTSWSGLSTFKRSYGGEKTPRVSKTEDSGVESLQSRSTDTCCLDMAADERIVEYGARPRDWPGRRSRQVIHLKLGRC
ncbi:hypothetical protein M8818_006478 [Zalaria obscura]|uniref:Uncharacterized protein n=1 Tax=Zalaria obscura TaxID=2024903 RepID=A0ACC3S6X6_9PEZI